MNDPMSDYRIGQKPPYVKPPSHSVDFKLFNDPIQGIYRTIHTSGIHSP